MPTTYSPSLRISLYGDGEQAGVWGQGTNLNLGTLIESAIAGRVQVPVTSANVTLSVSNGSDDQSRHMLIELTGASTNSFSVICPSADKLYLVWNNTTGGFNHTFRTAAGTGVSIGNGKHMMVWCDGVNVQEAVTHISTLLPLAGGDMTGALSLADGTVSIPAMNFTADPNSGLYRVGADTLGFATGGSQRLSISSTTMAVTNAMTVSGTSTLTGTVNAGTNLSVAGATTLQGATVINSTLNTTGSVNFAANAVIGDSTADAMTVNATSTFNGPVTFAGVPTFTGNVVIGDSGADTLSVVSTSTFTGAATVNGGMTFGSVATFNAVPVFAVGSTFTGTATHNGAAVFNNTVTLGDTTADAITVTGNTTVGSSTTLKKQSAGSFLSHASASNASGVVTVSSSAPSGGSDGDIWMQY